MILTPRLHPTPSYFSRKYIDDTEIPACPRSYGLEIELTIEQPKFTSMSKRVIMRLDFNWLRWALKSMTRAEAEAKRKKSASSLLTNFRTSAYVPNRPAEHRLLRDLVAIIYSCRKRRCLHYSGLICFSSLAGHT